MSTRSVHCRQLSHFLFCLLMLIATTAAAEVQPAHLLPVQPGDRIIRVSRAPSMDVTASGADAIWDQAQHFSVLYGEKSPEDTSRRTELKIVLCGESLFLSAKCHAPESAKANETELWRGDSLELFLSQNDIAQAYHQIMMSCDGRHVTTRHRTENGLLKQSTGVSPSPVKTIAGKLPGDAGWWLQACIPLDALGIPKDALRGNIIRNRATSGGVSSWVHLAGGSAHQPKSFAPLVVVDPQPAPIPSFESPTVLAVGTNVLKLIDYNDQFDVKLDGTPVRVEKESALIPVSFTANTRSKLDQKPRPPCVSIMRMCDRHFQSKSSNPSRLIAQSHLRLTLI
jgi:hypothetical protein